MALITFSTVNALIDELARLAGLSGNVGKDVKRMLDRLFGDGALRFCVSKNNTGILGFALYLELLRELIENLGDAHLAGEKTLLLIDVLRGEGPGQVSLVFTLRELPPGMRARQQLLCDMGSILTCFANLDSHYVCSLVEHFFGEFDAGRDPSMDESDYRGKIIERFEAIVRTGQGMPHEARRLLELARQLNPAIQVEAVALAA